MESKKISDKSYRGTTFVIALIGLLFGTNLVGRYFGNSFDEEKDKYVNYADSIINTNELSKKYEASLILVILPDCQMKIESSSSIGILSLNQNIGERDSKFEEIVLNRLSNEYDFSSIGSFINTLEVKENEFEGQILKFTIDFDRYQSLEDQVELYTTSIVVRTEYVGERGDIKSLCIHKTIGAGISYTKSDQNAYEKFANEL